MKATAVICGLLAAALSIYAEQATQPSAAPAGLKVAVFTDPDGGSTASNCVHATLGILHSNSFDVTTITPGAIRAGGLTNFTVVMFPGGGGTTQAKSLQQSGCAQVERFVARGGGFVGTCAGAFLAARGYNKETTWLELVDARVVDVAHWDRGTGEARIHILNPKHPILAGFPENLTVHYVNGPLLAPGTVTNPPPYETEAVFASDVHDHAPAGIMPGTTCMTTSTYQAGRCVLFSFHPELTPGVELMDVRAVLWAAGKL
ncbi:MAG TPA: BPL-N domain-containing protein [Candidatus Acidoferrum sp.]|nr:BPL-N domain-containing protein [Candidatus Acidoferrum sp.]